jgi:hypothetical protein
MIYAVGRGNRRVGLWRKLHKSELRIILLGWPVVDLLITDLLYNDYFCNIFFIVRFRL